MLVYVYLRLWWLLLFIKWCWSFFVRGGNGICLFDVVLVFVCLRWCWSLFVRVGNGICLFDFVLVFVCLRWCWSSFARGGNDICLFEVVLVFDCLFVWGGGGPVVVFVCLGLDAKCSRSPPETPYLPRHSICFGPTASMCSNLILFPSNNLPLLYLFLITLPQFCIYYFCFRPFASAQPP